MRPRNEHAEKRLLASGVKPTSPPSPSNNLRVATGVSPAFRPDAYSAKAAFAITGNSGATASEFHRLPYSPHATKILKN